MSPNCKFCNSSDLNVDIEYIVKISDGEVRERNLGTINAVCVDCNREQYLVEEDLPQSLVSSLLN